MGKMVCNTQQRGNYCKGDIDIYIYVYVDQTTREEGNCVLGRRTRK